MAAQFTLFGGDEEAHPEPAYPEGFRYRADLISPKAEDQLLTEVRNLPFREFEFHGFTGKRRVLSFGWQYDFDTARLRRVDEMPSFLRSLREPAAELAGLEPDAFEHALVTEYSAGAGIGWHRDKGVFGQIVGISLLAPCVFRLRREVGDRWERVNLTAQRRSGYLLSGPARSVWEHSIPPVDALRYSITFRSLRKD